MKSRVALLASAALAVPLAVHSVIALCAGPDPDLGLELHRR